MYMIYIYICIEREREIWALILLTHILIIIKLVLGLSLGHGLRCEEGLLGLRSVSFDVIVCYCVCIRMYLVVYVYCCLRFVVDRWFTFEEVSSDWLQLVVSVFVISVVISHININHHSTIIIIIN